MPGVEDSGADPWTPPPPAAPCGIRGALCPPTEPTAIAAAACSSFASGGSSNPSSSSPLLSLHFSTLSTPIGDCRRDEVDRKKRAVPPSAWEVRRRRAKQILGLLLRPLRAALLLPTSLGGSGRRSIREQLLPRVPGIGYYLVIRFEARDDPG